MTGIKPFRSDLGWRWEPFAGRWLLITDGGGNQVILSPDRHTHIQTRDLETGMLRNLAPSDHVAKIIAAAPDVRRHAEALLSGLDLGVIRIDPDDGSDRSTLNTILAALREALGRSGAA